MIKETIRFIIDVVKAIVLIRLIFKKDNSYDIPVDIVNIPIIGINNKSVINIIYININKNQFPSGLNI
jgi:hypothetical protein